MNKKLLRYGLIAVFVAIAFVLFSNRDSSEYPFRSEMRTLPKESALVTEYFTSAYRVFETEKAYVLEDLEFQITIYDGLVERYETLEKVPDHALEDYQAMLEAVNEQKEVFEAIYEVAKKGQAIPAELALELKKVVERRVLYEGRMGRY